jgi:hypothetical protein
MCYETRAEDSTSVIEPTAGCDVSGVGAFRETPLRNSGTLLGALTLNLVTVKNG